MSTNFTDILYTEEKGVATITINRPKVLNAFRAHTVEELIQAFLKAGWNRNVGVIVLTGIGDRAFSTGGDQSAHDGNYDGRGTNGMPIEELQSLIRDVPKPVIARVPGYAIGGGNVLATICDLTIASDKAIFGQVGPRMGSVDPGYGTAYLARVVGEKKAREIWYLCRRYSAREALAMGLVNTVVALDELEAEAVRWAREILAQSPMALRVLKAAFNADTDGLAGLQQLAGDATLLYYLSDEAQEGRDAYLQRRRPDFSKFPRYP